MEKQKGAARARPRREKIYMFTRNRGPLPWPFLVNLGILMVIGLVMLFSASYSTAYLRFGDSYHFIKSQFLYSLLGLALLYGVSRVDYRWLRRWTPPIYLLTIVLLIVVYTCTPINGCRRWLYWADTPLEVLPTIQVSELAKIAVILTTASLMVKYRPRHTRFLEGVVYPVAWLVPVVALVAPERHISGAILIALIVGSMMLLGGSGGKWLYIFGLGGIGLAVPSVMLLMKFNDTVAERVGNFLITDVSEMQLQTKQSLYAIGSGGWMGLGLGNSMEKHLYLPECTNDYIFSVICEELGLIGAVLVILLFLALIGQGIYIAMNAADLYGSFIAIGITAQIAWQVFLNVAVVTNSLPATGVGLPFFSSGGTSLLLLLIQMGMLCSVARAGAKAAEEKREQAAQKKERQKP